MFLVSITFPGLHFVGEGLQVRNAAVQALSGKDAQFDLGDIEPATVLGRVVQFENAWAMASSPQQGPSASAFIRMCACRIR